MLTDKLNLAKKPYSVKYSFRKRNWYLFPQRWTWKETITKLSWKREDIYKHTNYWLITKYQFSWLFIDMVWELNLSQDGLISHEEVRHEPIKYVNDKGELYKR